MKIKKGKDEEKNQVLSFIKHLKLKITDSKFPYFDPPDFQFTYESKRISLEHTRLFISNGGKIKNSQSLPIKENSFRSLLSDRITDKHAKEANKNYSKNYNENWLLIVIGEDLTENFLSLNPKEFEIHEKWIFDKIYLYSISSNKVLLLSQPT